MNLKPLHWNGYQYSLSIQRHWNTFFALATVFEIQRARMKKLLPPGAGYHIISIYELCGNAKSYFDTFDHWWDFSCRLCDQYCEFYVLERSDEDNTFNTYHNAYINDRYAVQNFAKESKGYIGPDEWQLT